MRFKKYMIRYNDTMQAISQRYFGTTDYWIDLVEHNNLRYPYIVDSSEEKLKDLEHLVTTGDTIIIPHEEYLTDVTIKEINKNDRDLMIEMALGSDLDVISRSKDIQTHGTSDEILSFSGDNKGDILTIKGIENMKQQLITKLLTPKGSLMLHPDYGSNLHELFGKNIPETGLLIEIEVHKTLLTDTRVKEVHTDSWMIEGNIYHGEFTVELMSVEESIKFILDSDENGNFVLF